MIDLGNLVNKMCENLDLIKPRDILVVWQNLGEINSLYKKENQQLTEKIKILEVKDFEKCPFRYSDIGCDYCDWIDRDLKEEYENELQEENEQLEVE